MTDEEKRSWAVRQLRTKQTDRGRIPLKSDFDGITLSRIKAFLGPWPRALEAAGLKEKSEERDMDARKKSVGKNPANHRMC